MMATGRSRPDGRESLQRFMLQGVRDTGNTVGDGSYATVKELDFHGLKCVGKKIHGILYNNASPLEKANMLERFAGECELLSQLHHPCIVQFLGVYFEEGSQLPVLVMEYLHTTVSSCIDRYGILPQEITYEVFRDVALGLRYLHEQSPPIVHRDLSANNVLLSRDMNAKISDLGVAKILNLRPSLMTQTQTPGTPCYMPPEAMVARPKYTSKVDIFSYGVMMVHMLSGQWPIPGSVFRVDADNPNSIVPLSEFQRREEYFQEISPDHPLMELIRLCLSNAPERRPEALEVLRQVKTVISQLPPSLGNKVETMQQLQSQGPNREVVTLRSEVETKTREIERLSGENEYKTREIEDKRRQIEAQRVEMEAKKRERETQGRENEIQRREIEAQRQQIELNNRDIESLRREIEALRRENEPLRWEIEPLRRENRLLREQLKKQSISFPKPVSSEPSTPVYLARLKWKRVADIPGGVCDAGSALGKVYIGGGVVGIGGTNNWVFQYDPRKDGWDTLPRCPVVYFGIAEFKGDLIIVGGSIVGGGDKTKKVHRYNEHSKKWEECLQPMPTARRDLSIVTTESAIVACGGEDNMNRPCPVVEIYLATADRWYTADPLPTPYSEMTSVRIGDIAYLLGGRVDFSDHVNTIFSVSVSTLIKKAISASHGGSLWNTMAHTPLKSSTAVGLRGQLLAIAGYDSVKFGHSSALHVFLPSTNTWERVPSGDLPESTYGPAAIQLSDNKLLVCSGFTSLSDMCRLHVWMGTIADK